MGHHILSPSLPHSDCKAPPAYTLSILFLSIIQQHTSVWLTCLCRFLTGTQTALYFINEIPFYFRSADLPRLWQVLSIALCSCKSHKTISGEEKLLPSDQNLCHRVNKSFEKSYSFLKLFRKSPNSIWVLILCIFMYLPCSDSVNSFESQ